MGEILRGDEVCCDEEDIRVSAHTAPQGTSGWAAGIAWVTFGCGARVQVVLAPGQQVPVRRSELAALHP